MEFKEPKVEVIRIETKEVVFASGAGGVEYCEGSGQQINPSCSTDYSRYAG